MDNDTTISIKICAERYLFYYPKIMNQRMGNWYVPKPNKDGYPEISFRYRKLGINQKVPVHRIVAYNKYGEQVFNPGILVRHRDHNKSNFHPDNILIGISLDNYLDNPDHVKAHLALAGSSAAKLRRKFSPETVVSIKSDRESGMLLKELAAKYKCAKSTMSCLINSRTYKT